MTQANLATPAHVVAPTPAELAAALRQVRSIPDYPEPGVLFRDVLPLFAQPHAFDVVLRALVAPFNGTYDVVAGVEARGFLIAGAVAARVGCGLVPIRKAGKLPKPAASRSYDLEYGSATIEMQRDVAPGTRILILDDVLATGGTLAASCALVRDLGYEVAGVGALIELAELAGRPRLEGESLHSVEVF
ncbi:adenine phosphoribosyltransferase [Gulosibacter sp. ACHW.36C]|uniref:adenine phosphoribosyltransferase n=1 Tax=Gulosibacter sp. ACHW.36C TaxID=3434457 RepID=UPI003D663268